MAMFAALALGAPVGTVLYATGGFAAVALATALVPLLTILLVAAVPPIRPRAGAWSGFLRVAGAAWMPGLASAFSSIGFGAMIAFSSVFFAEHGWNPVWLAFSAFAAALIAARVFLGHLPDTFGGARVALFFVLIEAAGLALMWLAPGPVAAAAGAALAGFGYSLVYPGLGVEAVRHAPPESRGLAMGMYTAFLDMALGFGSPVLGLIAGWAGLGSVFLASTVIVLGTAPIAARLASANGRWGNSRT
jgi:MFS family permease